MKLTETDYEHLERCLELAEEALSKGDQPFGSVLVSAKGEVLFEDHNQVNEDPTHHPEFEIARWAAKNLSPDERNTATVYTSGEHCPMCSAAHAWAQLGRIIYVCSAELLNLWRTEWQAPDSPVAAYKIQDIAPGIEVLGPVPELLEKSKKLYERAFNRH